MEQSVLRSHKMSHYVSVLTLIIRSFAELFIQHRMEAIDCVFVY